jgi:hypothetical protein
LYRYEYGFLVIINFLLLSRGTAVFNASCAFKGQMVDGAPYYQNDEHKGGN